MLSSPAVFERPIDQRLFDTLRRAHSYEGNIAEKINEAAALIADGADVNAEAASSEVPHGFMLGCILADLDYDNPARLAVIDLFLKHGFDPDKGMDDNGAQALAFLVNFCEGDPDGKVLEGVKTLLRRGCNPFVEVKLYESDIDEFDARRWAEDELGDVLMCDHDRPSLDAYAAIEWCLQKFQNGDNFESVAQVEEAVGWSVDEIRTKGKFVLKTIEKAGKWKYQQRLKPGEPFDSGILLKCENRWLFIDPCWGVFTDTDLPKEWGEQLSEPLDLSVNGKILGIDEEFVRGELQITLWFEKQIMVINHREKTLFVLSPDEIPESVD